MFILKNQEDQVIFNSKNHVQRVTANIQILRKLRKYSQTDIGAKIGISQNGYSKIEKGLSELSLVNLFLIAEALDINIEDIISLDFQQMPEAIQMRCLSFRFK